MAIHDRGKPGATPQPNSHDLQGVRMAHGTNSVNYTTDATDTSKTSGILSGIGQLVQTDTVNVPNNGATQTHVTVPHNLGYVPFMMSAVNNASISDANGVVSSNASVFLPTSLSTFIDTVDNIIVFRVWLFGFADETNAYFIMTNSTGSPVSIDVTYYLYRQNIVQV